MADHYRYTPHGAYPVYEVDLEEAPGNWRCIGIVEQLGASSWQARTIGGADLGDTQPTRERATVVLRERYDLKDGDV